MVNGNSFKLILFQAINTLHLLTRGSVVGDGYSNGDSIKWVLRFRWFRYIYNGKNSLWITQHADMCVLRHQFELMQNSKKCHNRAPVRLKISQIQRPGHNVSCIIYDVAHKLRAIDRYTRYRIVRMMYGTPTLEYPPRKELFYFFVWFGQMEFHNFLIL